MSTALRYVPSPDVLVSHLDGEAILLHMGSKHYFRLNRVGAHVWKLLESGLDTDSITAQLVATFDVSSNVATDAVNALLRDLSEQTLIRQAT
ncbi:MAG: hypothetical protein JWM95_3190 [Gemmatimonadetes bacterium]|nr:hypothetical protein [Gemmatimonadota bacterium]